VRFCCIGPIGQADESHGGLAVRSTLLWLLLILGTASVADARKPAASVLHSYNSQPTTYGFGVPSYRWGWFGAHYWPRMTYHCGFYGDRMQWSYRYGY
jgi:hypothetical protein